MWSVLFGFIILSWNATIMNDRWYCNHFVLFISTYSSVCRLALPPVLIILLLLIVLCYPNILVEKIPLKITRTSSYVTYLMNSALSLKGRMCFFFLLCYHYMIATQFMLLLTCWVMFIPSATLGSPFRKKPCIIAMGYFHIYDHIWLS